MKKKLFAIFVICALCSLVSITAWAFWSMHSKQKPSPIVSATSIPNATDTVMNGELPVGDYEKTNAMLQHKVDATKFEIKINTCIQKDAATGMYAALIGNTERNHYNCYVSILDPSGSTLYTSPILKPGQYLPYITFSQPIPDMDADAYFCVLDQEQTLIGKVAVGIKLKG